MSVQNTRLVKLVRDRIHELLPDHVEVRYDHVPAGELIGLMRRKLIEESLEYMLDPSVEEAADVLELLRTLVAKDLRVDWDEVERVADAKCEERGGFEEGMGMYVQKVGYHG